MAGENRESGSSPKFHETPLGFIISERDEFGRDALLQTRKRVKTGFARLNDLLGGGFEPGLIILGGSPGLGKSTLALFIAEYVASNGTPVRFYSYEMTSNRLAHKLIACQNYKVNSGDRSLLFQAKEVFNPEALEKWSKDKWREYENARQAVSKSTENLYIIDCNTIENRYTARQIAEDVENFTDRLPADTKPLVIVDYLQILPSDDSVRTKDARQIIEDNLVRLVALSKNVPVILISSLSRDSYKKPIQIESFKETGSIEYSADVLLGLQFSACQDEDGNPAKNWNLNAEKEKTEREIDIVVLKQRYGELGKVPIYYYPEYDYFSAARVGDGTVDIADFDGDDENIAPPKPEKRPPAAEQELSYGSAAATASPTGNTQTQKQKKQKYCSMNNTKIAHELRKGDAVPNEEHKCKVLRIREKDTQNRDVFTTYLVSSFNHRTADAICSIFRSGQSEFTPRHLLADLYGDGSRELSVVREMAIHAAIDKLRSTQISIDCPNGTAFRGPLLSIETRDGAYRFPGTQPEALKDIMPLHAYGEVAEKSVFRTGDGAADMFSCTERAIAEAIYSIYRSGRREFTSWHILDTLSDDGSSTPTAGKAETIHTCIEKLRQTRIAIDCTEEMCGLGSKAEKIEFRGAFLSVEAEKHGEVYSYSFAKEDLSDVMPLYAYTEAAGQVSCADCDTADAVYSIFLSKKKEFTLQHILTALTGDSSRTLTAQKAEMLRACIEKLRNIQITIDCTEEMCGRGKNKDDTDTVFSGPLLTIEERNGEYSFPSVDSDDLKDIMPLYAYAGLTGQIVSFPMSLLKVKAENGKNLSNTTENIAIKHFLIYRLEVLRNQKTTLSQKISFKQDSELFKVLGLRSSDFEDAYWKRKCKQIAETVETILQHFRTVGYIDGYEATGADSFLITGRVNNPRELKF